MIEKLQLGAVSKPINYSAQLYVKSGSLSQIYHNATGEYSPDRTATSNALVLGAHVVINDPNKADGKQQSVGNVTSVAWYYAKKGSSDDISKMVKIADMGNAFTVDDSAHELTYKGNLPDTQTGARIFGVITFTDPVKGTSVTTIDNVTLTTNINTVTRLELRIEKGEADAPYGSENFILNPILRPLNSKGTNWMVHCRCQEYDGNLTVADAYTGTKRTGNAFYFWYYKNRQNQLTRITDNNDWFSGTKYADGTWSKECVVNMAKMRNVELICKAGFIPYGELVDYADAAGQILPSKTIGFLETSFKLGVALPPITGKRFVTVANDMIQQKDFNASDLSKVPVIRRFFIESGGVVLNLATNPLKATEGDTRNLCDVLYTIKWYMEDKDGNYVKIGSEADTKTGETLVTNLKELGATSADKLPKLVVDYEPNYPDLWGDNYCDEYDSLGDNCDAIGHHGNKAFLKNLDFALFDVTDNTDADGNARTEYPAAKLMRNNILRYADGSYAPVVGITEDMKKECTDNILYSDSAAKTVAYAQGKYNAITEWETYDKPLMKTGSKPRTLYKKASDGTISAVSHKLRPWETTETKYSIGVGYLDGTVYFLDNVKGDSGKKWKGIFTDVTEWDGIDLTKYALPTTVLSPGAFTTIGGKARDFFYLFASDDANSQGSCGATVSEWVTANLPSITPYKEGRAYPRCMDVSQITSMTYCRANNKDADSPVPMAEGGYFTLDAFISFVELTMGSQNLVDVDRYGSGISSNDGPSASNFFKVGGVKFKKSSATDYTYASWGANHAFNVGGVSATTSWSNFVNGYAPKAACMEAQLAASMAVELGIAATTESGKEHTFYMYGNKYYYMDVNGVDGLSKGYMNARVYKITSYNYTDATEGAMTCEFRLRMSLFAGAELSGDVLRYCGGGAELVATILAKRDDNLYGNTINFWLQPDQSKWKKITTVTVANTSTKFGFEDSYIKLIDGDSAGIVTVSDGWRKNRFPYTPFAVDSSTGSSKGDSMFIQNNNWYNTSGVGQKTRLALRFGLSAAYGFCAPRSLICATAANYALLSSAGRAQARVSITQ